MFVLRELDTRYSKRVINKQGRGRTRAEPAATSAC